MEISGKGLLHFDQETSSLIGNQTYHRTNMFSPYQPNSCYESDYECICIMINGKTCSVPLNILSSVYVLNPTESGNKLTRPTCMLKELETITRSLLRFRFNPNDCKCLGRQSENQASFFSYKDKLEN